MNVKSWGGATSTHNRTVVQRHLAQILNQSSASLRLPVTLFARVYESR